MLKWTNAFITPIMKSACTEVTIDALYQGTSIQYNLAMQLHMLMSKSQ